MAKKYDETIYGKSGWIYRSVTVRYDQRDNKLYAYILNLKDDALYLPMQGKKVCSAKVFIDQKPLKFTEVPGGVVVKRIEFLTTWIMW